MFFIYFYFCIIFCDKQILFLLHEGFLTTSCRGIMWHCSRHPSPQITLAQRQKVFSKPKLEIWVNIVSLSKFCKGALSRSRRGATQNMKWQGDNAAEHLRTNGAECENQLVRFRTFCSRRFRFRFLFSVSWKHLSVPVAHVRASSCDYRYFSDLKRFCVSRVDSTTNQMKANFLTHFILWVVTGFNVSRSERFME